MKKLGYMFLSVMLALTLTGCGTAWWTNFKNNPVVQVDSVIQGTQVVLAMADVVFQQVKTNLPVDKQEVAQQKYDSAVIIVTKSLISVRDALQTAADAKQDNPDLTKVLADLKSAVAGVQAVINEFRALVKVPVAVAVTTGGAPGTSVVTVGGAGGATVTGTNSTPVAGAGGGGAPAVVAAATVAGDPIGLADLNTQIEKLNAQLK
jgi:hypothetical protein